MSSDAHHRYILPLAAVFCLGFAGSISARADDPVGPWVKSNLAQERFIINGTGGRHNALRRSIRSEHFPNKIFVRFKLLYRADSVDLPDTGNGEFFVLWFDSAEGNDDSPHANNVPNLGIHTNGNANQFMVRYRSDQQRFGPNLKGGTEYDLVGCLSKTDPQHDQPFDQLSLWVNPKSGDRDQPDAVTRSPKTITRVNWIGFSTGLKTEIDDEIQISQTKIGRSWNEVMNLSAVSDAESNHQDGLRKLPAKTVSFSQHVLPILKERCFSCHGAEKNEGDVRLDQFDDVLNQVVPFDANASHLFHLVVNAEMPPEDVSLDPGEINVLRAWIDEGLEWDHLQLPTLIPSSDHWAFQPLASPTIPRVQDHARIRNPIDAFMVAAQEAKGVVGNLSASDRVLRRRLYLDLHGKPAPKITKRKLPSAGELFADPAYGERWARHWLDVARWAESNGYQHNRDRQFAWLYRDWVINAFTQGLPYDDFLKQQIAGDQITPFDNDNLVATGFLSAARYSGNELDKQVQRNDILNDITSATGSAFLGLTVECAQCHDHKFDPISIRDYYQLQGFFVNGQPQNLLLQNEGVAGELARERRQLLEAVRTRIVRVRRQQGFPDPIYVTPKTVLAQMRSSEKARLKQIDKSLSLSRQAWAFYSPGTASAELTVMPHEMRWPLNHQKHVLEGQDPRILIRGDVKTPGPKVIANWPAIFQSSLGTSIAPTKTRLDLANWLASPQNPLTARVWVNRLWQWHFGRGLVETANDFGIQGLKPKHAKLLDYLALELIRTDWDTRYVQRLIVESATYRMSSDFHEANHLIDPENQFYWRWQPRRLQAEVIRDSILCLSGADQFEVGGPSVKADSLRRSLYLPQRREHFPPQQTLFDGPSGVVSCPSRSVSTNALQPLWLLNSSFIQEMAILFAKRAGTVEEVVRLALHRDPSSDEKRELQQLADQHGLGSACLAVINSSEFLYVP
ncbi:PSD1 and planctomycete cytochrome C domain-containing protein [Rhodopirellula sp.]|nr:PSD1 and planctomycete cytochrome C domain-containing protein [Rhodopirellula sp.]MDB4678844.1 PSD1 and planctomycete cytochrome C domain-containing protein [Rhodopirellula sp.]